MKTLFVLVVVISLDYLSTCGQVPHNCGKGWSIVDSMLVSRRSRSTPNLIM